MRRLETEVKLLLPSCADYLKLIGCLGPIDEEQDQQNGFFDSVDHQLAAKGWALRVRAERDRGLVTLKGSRQVMSVAGKAVTREEIEEEISGSLARELLESRRELMSLEIEPILFARNLVPEFSPVQYVRFRNIRKKKRQSFGDKSYVLEIDQTQFADGSSDYELEIELDSPESAVDIECHLRHLFGTLGIVFQAQPRSKLERAIERAVSR